jgi:hypothetical protein
VWFGDCCEKLIKEEMLCCGNQKLTIFNELIESKGLQWKSCIGVCTDTVFPLQWYSGNNI